MTNGEEFFVACGLVPRPQDELLDLPTNFRWEFSRRHPYYLLLWQQAARYRRSELGPEADEILDGYCAMHLLGMIGIHGEPPDPAKSFDELGDFDPNIGSGTVQPMTIRNILQALIAALPSAELCSAGATLFDAGDKELAIPEDEGLRLQRRKAQLQLMRMPSQAFDSHLSSPLYYIHSNASLRRITEDLEILVRSCKQSRDIPERRLRKHNFAEYLDVWDAREGWSSGTYCAGHEQTFEQIAKHKRLPKSTVASRYQAAFRQIVGTEFDPIIWLLVMGQLKLPWLNDSPAQKLKSRYRRILADNHRKPIPESQVSPMPEDNRGSGLIERESARQCDHEETDLCMDIMELIRRGLSDNEIVENLDLSVDVGLEYFRERLTEMGDVTF